MLSTKLEMFQLNLFQEEFLHWEAGQALECVARGDDAVAIPGTIKKKQAQ